MTDSIRLDGKVALITGQVLVADGGAVSHVPGIAGFRAFFAGGPS